MIAAWMLYTLMVGALVALAARAAEALLRARGLPARAAWSVAVLLMLSLPVLTAFRSPAAENPSPAAAANLATPIQTAKRPEAVATFPDRPSLDRPLLVAWSAASLVLLGLLLHGTGVLHGRRREWREAEVDGRRLLVSPDVGPAVVGWRRMQIVIPAWVLGLDRESRGIVLAHEEEHIRRHDPWLLLATLVAVALVPWNLALWYAARRLRLAVELDCDARVVARGVDRYRYGQVLLEAGSRTRTAGLPALATFAERPTQLESRLSALAPRSAARRPPRAFAAGGAAGLLLAAACTMDNPLGIDLSDRELVSKVRLSQELPAVDNPEVVSRIVRSLVAARFPDALRTGSVPDGVTAVLVLDPQRRILRAGTRGGPGVGDSEIHLEDLAGEGIESIEVIRGRAIGVENLEGVILVQLREPGQGRRALRTSVEAASGAEALLTPKVVLRQRDR